MNKWNFSSLFLQTLGSQKLEKKSFLLIVFLLLTQASCAAQYHLIWQIDTVKFFEVDWVKEVLEHVDYDEIFDGKFEIARDNSIIVVCGTEPDYIPYLDKLSENGYKFGLFIVSDERYVSKDYHENARFELRQYWHKKYAKHTHIMPIPLGYARGFYQGGCGDCQKTAHKRNYTWVFAGQITKSTRQAMYSNFKLIPNGYLYTIEQFAAENSLSKSVYRSLLQDAIFAPAPCGWWNLESFRVYEALESGAIPIVEKNPIDYFKLLLGDYPFPSVKSWDNAPFLINKLLANPERLEKLRVKCHIWWNNYKASLKQKIKNFINEKMN